MNPVVQEKNCGRFVADSVADSVAGSTKPIDNQGV